MSILEDMKMKAREELNTMAVAEKQSLHSFMMLKQSLEMQISANQKEMDQAKLLKATAQQEKAVAEADLEGTQKESSDLNRVHGGTGDLSANMAIISSAIYIYLYMCCMQNILIAIDIPMISNIFQFDLCFTSAKERQASPMISEFFPSSPLQDLANDQESLRKLELSCSQATRDYEDSSKSRAEEMEALKKAEKVLAEKTGATIKSVPWQGGRGGCFLASCKGCLQLWLGPLTWVNVVHDQASKSGTGHKYHK